MDQTNTRFNRIRAQLPGIVGIGALAALAILGVVYGGSHVGAGRAFAGSGDAPTNTTYVQPTVAPVTMGATTTMTPSSVMPTAKAVPQVKAGG